MPDITYEREAAKAVRSDLIAGIDEAGRGALAGPVYAAAVILPIQTPHLIKKLEQVNDSKQLKAKKREAFFELIVIHAVAWGIGFAPAHEIDEIGIVPATKKAMMSAVQQLARQPAYLLIDGRIKLEDLPIDQQSIIRGDGKSLSIAAASILAKVSRDKMMVKAGHHWPDYQFENHKGYGTRLHREKIKALGGTSIHRKSFAPLRDQIEETK
ncbi:MAG: ribonuclease HII [Chloroflexota bacterium]